MSLTLEQFDAAYKQWKKMNARLTKLIGFNPATSNHYGRIQLYNHYVSDKTTDEEILALRAQFVQWRTAIFAFFHEKEYAMNDETFDTLFSFDPMCGTIMFLGEMLDLSKEMEFYYTLIENYIKESNKK